MPAHPRRFPTCKPCNKKLYPKRILAEDMAAYRMSVDPTFVISVYECPTKPGKWHITKSNQLARQWREKQAQAPTVPPTGPPPSPPTPEL